MLPPDPLEYPRLYRSVVWAGVAAMAFVWVAILASLALVGVRTL